MIADGATVLVWFGLLLLVIVAAGAASEAWLFRDDESEGE